MPNDRLPWQADEARHVPASPPAIWLRVVKKLTGVHGPDAGVLWAATVACLRPLDP